MRLISQVHHFLSLRNVCIERLENRYELFDERTTLPIDHLTRGCHHFFPNLEEFIIGCRLALEQRIPLLQCLVVSDQCFEVFLVVLRYHHIHETTALLAPTRNQVGVGRRNHHQRNEANVVGQAGIFLLIALELLLLASLHATIHLFGIARFRFIHPLNHKKVLLVHHVLRVDGIRGTLAERQIIHRIQQICLPHTILTDDTIHLGREIQFHLLQVFIIQYRNTL